MINWLDPRVRLYLSKYKTNGKVIDVTEYTIKYKHYSYTD